MRVLFHTLTNIGDVVLTTAALRPLVEQNLDLKVDVICGAGAAPLFEGLSCLGRLMTVTKQKYHLHHLHAWRQVVAQRYDLVIDFKNPVMPYLVLRKKFLKPLPKKLRDGMHRAESYGAVLQGKQYPVRTGVWPKQADAAVAHDMRSKVGDGQILVIAPTANWIGKQWPQAYWAELVKKLEARKGPKLHYAVLGAAKERPSVEDFISTLPPDRTFDFVGKTNLGAACHIIGHADAFVGNDSGLGHIAAAYNKPEVSIFGPSDDSLYRPYSHNAVVVAPPPRSAHLVNLDPGLPPRLVVDVAPQTVFTALAGILPKKENAA